MERITDIIRKLGTQKGYVKINDLADSFGVTPRTIRNDLEELEIILERSSIHLQKDRKLGVRLSKNGMSEADLSKLIRKINNDKDYHPKKERERIIMEQLLFSGKPVTLKELEELTLTSRTSLQKDLNDCEERLKSWNIALKKTQHVGLQIEASEHDWRNGVLKYIISSNKGEDFQRLYSGLMHGESEWLCLVSRQLFQDINKVFVVNFIRRYETRNKIRFTDSAFVSVFVFLCIAIYENVNGRYLEENDTPISNFYNRNVLNRMIDESIAFINEGSPVELSRNELQAILVFMLSQKRINDESYQEEAFLLNDEGFLNKSYEIVKSFIEAIDEYLNTSLSNDSKLFDNLLLHIRPTIFRLLFGIVLDNPLVSNIKESFPEVFMACKYAGQVITRETGGVMNDSEISYLALHVQGSIEKKSENSFSGLYKTLIVCPEGVGTSTILYYKLLNSIPNIVIDRICSIHEFDQIDKEKIDLVISTVPLHPDRKSNVAVVNPLLYDEDILKIRQVMRKISVFRNVSNVDLMVSDILSLVSRHALISDYPGLENALGSYFDGLYYERKNKKPSLRCFVNEEVLQLKQSVSSWKEAYEKAGKILLNLNCITPGYIDECIEAVDLYGPYMFIGEGVALMHANSPNHVKKIAMSFLTLKDAVDLRFENKSYPIRFVVCLSAREDLEHLQALGELIEITSDPKKVSKLIEIEDKQEFEEYIISHIGDVDMSQYE